MENAGPGCGVPGYGIPGCGKRGAWKTRGVETRGLVENEGSGGKRGVLWKTRGLVENAGSGGKHGVWWKMRVCEYASTQFNNVIKFKNIKKFIENLR